MCVCKYKGVTNETGKLRTKIKDCMNVKCDSNDWKSDVDQSLKLRSPQRLDSGYASVFRRNGGSGEIALVRPLINLVPDPENMPS